MRMLQKPQQDYASVVIPFTKKGLKLVRDMRRLGKKYWKFPGGKGNKVDRDAVDAGVRETREETGIRNIYRDDLELVREPWEKPSNKGGIHLFHLFVGVIPDERELVEGPSITGEESRYFNSLEEVRDCPDVLSSHREFLTDPDMLADIEKARRNLTFPT